MKKQLILGSLLALSQITSAQNNVFPTPSGNVGIGTTTPAAKLDVLSTTNQLRLSNSSTIYSDINSTTNGLIFLPSSTANKVAFGIAAPATGNGFHSNMGRFLMTDPAAPWPRGIIFQPNQTAGGDMPAGAAITSGITAANAGEGLSLVPCAYGYNGVKLGAYAYCSGIGGGWKSVWETANTTAGTPTLALVKNGGNVGIGTTTPRAKLDVNGKVYIGTQAPLISGPHNDAMLAVDGKILAKSIYVNIATGTWADYVFDENYKLMSLTQVEEFYSKNHHLPGIQSAKQIEENGVSLEEMNIKLLEKIEELTIYLVKQQKDIDALKKCK